MKIFYYQSPNNLPNFGDDLNLWLWPKLLNNFFDQDDETVFIGIGTLLNHRLPQRISQAKKVLIFSTGAGYEYPLLKLPKNWHIYCVRGPLTAKRLSLSEEQSITDGALLIRKVFQPSGEKTSSFAWMPHLHHAKTASKIWKAACQELGFQYIDPRWSIETILSAIAQTEVLIAEAMHGAIVADALRVPWIPVITGARILRYKWQDWCLSIGLTYEPYYFQEMERLYPKMPNQYKTIYRSCKYRLFLWRYYGLPASNSDRTDQVMVCKNQLQQVAKSALPQLSSEAKLNDLTERLEQRLDLLRTQNQSM